MQLGIYGDHKVYKVQITDNTKPVQKTRVQKTRVLKNGKTIPTWSFMQKLAKNI
jgi:hypothetical protein